MKKFICKQLPSPQSFEDSIKYIKQSTQFSYQKHLNQAISIAAKQFKNIDFSILRDLPSFILSQIINSAELVVPNESYLFTIVKQLIAVNQHNQTLLSKIQLPFVDSNLIKDFFEQFEIENLDQELFEQIKKRLYLDVFIQSDDIPTGRWEEQPTLFDLKEIKEIFQTLDEFFQTKENRSSNLKQLIDENISFKKKKEKQIKDIQFIQNSRDGIVSFLKNKFGSDIVKSIVFGCSSTGGSIEYIFDWTDNSWNPSNTQNSWFCVHFNHLKISLSGYRLKAYDQSNRPTGWKLEGSNDQKQWTLIDQRNDELNNSDVENSFSVQSSDFFSTFKFTQTKINGNNNWLFYVKSVEFFGKISSSKYSLNE
jgi:hypothetical protein